MTYEHKMMVKDFISKDKNWVVIDGILGEEVSVLAWGEEVDIIYEDMDGHPCQCRAECIEPSMGRKAFFRATSGPAEGNRMCNVIAYRRRKEGVKRNEVG